MLLMLSCVTGHNPGTPWLIGLTSNLKREHVVRLMLTRFIWDKILTPLQAAKTCVYRCEKGRVGGGYACASQQHSNTLCDCVFNGLNSDICPAASVHGTAAGWTPRFWGRWQYSSLVMRV